MEFSFDTTKVLKCDGTGYAMIDGRQSQLYKRRSANESSAFGRGSGRNHAVVAAGNELEDIIDRMGAASAKAQGLPQVITTASRLFTSFDRLYMRAEGNKVIGLLKVGKRNLFINYNVVIK